MLLTVFIFAFAFLFTVAFNEKILIYPSPEADRPSGSVKYGTKLDFYYNFNKPIRFACSGVDCLPTSGFIDILNFFFALFIIIDSVIIMVSIIKSNRELKKKRLMILGRILLLLLFIPLSVMNPFLYVLIYVVVSYFDIFKTDNWLDYLYNLP
jgi:hypothetical protein